MKDRNPLPDAAALALLDPDGSFLGRLRQDRAALTMLIARLRKSDGDTKAQLGSLATLAHRLAGAAGTFGYGAIGDAAVELEDRLEAADIPRNGSAGMAIDMAARLVELLDEAAGDHGRTR